VTEPRAVSDGVILHDQASRHMPKMTAWKRMAGRLRRKKSRIHTETHAEVGRLQLPMW
jgi:hypothetical protein